MKATQLAPLKGLISGLVSGLTISLLLLAFIEFKWYRLLDESPFKDWDKKLIAASLITIYGLTFLIPAMVALRVQTRKYRTNYWRSFLFLTLAGWMHFWFFVSAVSMYEDSWPDAESLGIMAAVVLTPTTLLSLLVAALFRKPKNRIASLANGEVLDDQLVDE